MCRAEYIIIIIIIIIIISHLCLKPYQTQAEFLNDKSGSAQNNHWALRGSYGDSFVGT